MLKLYQEDITDIQKKKPPVFYKLKYEKFKDLPLIVEKSIKIIYITETGFHYSIAKINMRTYICVIFFFPILQRWEHLTSYLHQRK